MQTIIHKPLSAADRSQSESQPVAITFNFDEHVEGVTSPVPSVSPLQQENFRTTFGREAGKLQQWAAEEKWPLPSRLPNLQVFVSGQYQNARALLPQWK